MVGKAKRLFVGYAFYTACVVVFFGTTGFQKPGSRLIEWIGLPGGFAALWSVGVHSDHFDLAYVLENIAFYLIVPILLWMIFVRRRKHRDSELPEKPADPPKR